MLYLLYNVIYIYLCKGCAVTCPRFTVMFKDICISQKASNCHTGGCEIPLFMTRKQVLWMIKIILISKQGPILLFIQLQVLGKTWFSKMQQSSKLSQQLSYSYRNAQTFVIVYSLKSRSSLPCHYIIQFYMFSILIDTISYENITTQGMINIFPTS